MTSNCPALLIPPLVETMKAYAPGSLKRAIVRSSVMVVAVTEVVSSASRNPVGVRH